MGKLDSRVLHESFDSVLEKLQSLFKRKKRSDSFNMKVERMIILVRGHYDRILRLPTCDSNDLLPDGDALTRFLSHIYSQKSQSFFRALEWIKSYLVSFVDSLGTLQNLEGLYLKIVKSFEVDIQDVLSRMEICVDMNGELTERDIVEQRREYVHWLEVVKRGLENQLEKKKKLVAGGYFAIQRENGSNMRMIFTDLKERMKITCPRHYTRNLKKL